MNNVLDLLLPFCLMVGCVLASRSLIHYFQLESYQFPGYFRTLKRNWRRAVAPGLLMTAIWLITSAAAMALTDGRENETTALIVRLVWCLALPALGWLVRCMTKSDKEKKPLKLTARVKRLYVVALLVYTGLWFLIDALGRVSALRVPAMYLCMLYPLFLPFLLALAGLIAWPVEKGISELYFRDARRKLMRQKDLIRVGITGSYGKTSVKFILETILQERYRVLVTPASFNTPMGVTRVIRNDLEPGCQVFVSEMGARHVGDIKEMCRLVHPTIGVITSVGPQHLDTFKTLERVKETKYELIRALPEDGCAFFPDDGGICRELYDRTTDKERHLAGGTSGQRDVWAENLQVSARGSTFDLCTRDERVSCTTALLGTLNIQNILLAASVALRLGMSARNIANGIRRLKPVEHRLQLLPSRGGITMIDDAFNSNPKGSLAALEVLKQFPSRRVVITPGMVELGEKEAEFNKQFGAAMASCADIVILVGKKHTEPIAEGLLENGFSKEALHVTANLDEAAALMRQLATSGDTVLFENDLPDNYTE